MGVVSITDQSLYQNEINAIFVNVVFSEALHMCFILQYNASKR
jgi:hypothetical protein